jgi:DeoR/GlpR family transcriptional regulator of sugar metabolism
MRHELYLYIIEHPHLQVVQYAEKLGVSPATVRTLLTELNIPPGVRPDTCIGGAVEIKQRKPLW